MIRIDGPKQGGNEERAWLARLIEHRATTKRASRDAGRRGPQQNIVYARRLAGPVDAAALEARLDDLVQSREALRTIVVLVGDRPMAVHVAVAARLDVIHLRAGADLDAEIAERVAFDRATPFDPRSGPRIRATLLRAPRGASAIVVATERGAADPRWPATLWRELDIVNEMRLARAGARLARGPERRTHGAA